MQAQGTRRRFTRVRTGALVAGAIVLAYAAAVSGERERHQAPEDLADLTALAFLSILDAADAPIGTDSGAHFLASAIAHGKEAALDQVLANPRGLRTPRRWLGLELGLETLGPERGAALLRERRPRWPAGAHARLEAILDHLEFRAERARTGISPSTPGVEQAVRRVLAAHREDTGFSPGEPWVDELLDLGPAAVRPLLEALGDGCTGEPRLSHRGAAQALEWLARDEDVEDLERLLRDGCCLAAEVLAARRSDAALAALRREAERPDGGSCLTAPVLGRLLYDARTAPVLRAWLRRQEPRGRLWWTEAHVVDALVRAMDRESVPILRERLALSDETGRSRRLADALARLGDAAGIEFLVHSLRSAGDDWYVVADLLKEIAGNETPLIPDLDRGNRVEVVRQYEAWWAGGKSRPRFDPSTGAWRTGS